MSLVSSRSCSSAFSFSSIGLHDEYSQFKRQWGIDADWHDLYGGDGRHGWARLALPHAANFKSCRCREFAAQRARTLI